MDDLLSMQIFQPLADVMTDLEALASKESFLGLVFLKITKRSSFHEFHDDR